MKLLRQVLTLCAFVGVLGGAGSSQAAEVAKPAAAKETPKDIVLKGDAKCTTCHDENDAPEQLAIGKTRHGVTADKRAPTCTSCHGESEAHIKEAGRGDKKPPAVEVGYTAKSKASPEARNDACMSCHKGGNRMHWAGSAHQANDVACSSCHQIHKGKDTVRDKTAQGEVCFTCHKEQRAESLRASTHPIRAGGVPCSSCHNVHGSTGPKLLVKSSTNETCHTCHAEKRGPFLWEHPSASDDCMNCHTPHGSNHTPLLKARQPYLCSSCHIAGGHSATGIRSGNDLGAAVVPGGAASAASQMVGKACTNCHTQVHGSNHPSGSRFVR